MSSWLLIQKCRKKPQLQLSTFPEIQVEQSIILTPADGDDDDDDDGDDDDDDDGGGGDDDDDDDDDDDVKNL